MTAPKKPRLKKCPGGCKEIPDVWSYHDGVYSFEMGDDSAAKRYYVYCFWCGWQGPAQETPAKAIAAWNRRARGK